MKKALCIVGVIFLLAIVAFAVHGESASPVDADAFKAGIFKAAKMHATGRVVDISDESVKIERTVKGNVETMEFALEKPVKNIHVSDSVKIDYVEKEGKLLASRVVKVVFKSKHLKPAP